MKINPANVEELLFSEPRLWNELPNCRVHYDHWKMISFFPGMSADRKKICISLLNSIGTQEIAVLERHFGEEVIIEGVDLRLTDHRHVDTQGCEELEVCSHFTELVVTRNQGECSVTFWR